MKRLSPFALGFQRKRTRALPLRVPNPDPVIVMPVPVPAEALAGLMLAMVGEVTDRDWALPGGASAAKPATITTATRMLVIRLPMAPPGMACLCSASAPRRTSGAGVRIGPCTDGLYSASRWSTMTGDARTAGAGNEAGFPQDVRMDGGDPRPVGQEATQPWRRSQPSCCVRWPIAAAGERPSYMTLVDR